jgi:DNA-binding transcriptional MocR family regulator
VSERRELRRRLGPVAWCALEDLAEDAEQEAAGRRVVRSNVRALAANLGVSKDTAARALRRLATADLIASLPVERGERGRFGSAAYELRAQPCAIPPGGATSSAAPEPGRRRPPQSVRAGRAGFSQPSLFDADALNSRAGDAGNREPADARTPDAGNRETADARNADAGNCEAEDAGDREAEDAG